MDAARGGHLIEDAAVVQIFEGPLARGCMEVRCVLARAGGLLMRGDVQVEKSTIISTLCALRRTVFVEGGWMETPQAQLGENW